MYSFPYGTDTIVIVYRRLTNRRLFSSRFADAILDTRKGTYLYIVYYITKRNKKSSLSRFFYDYSQNIYDFGANFCKLRAYKVQKTPFDAVFMRSEAYAASKIA